MTRHSRQRLKPLQWLATSTEYFAPNAALTFSHWFVLSLVGANVDAGGTANVGGSAPAPRQTARIAAAGVSAAVQATRST